MNTLSQCPICDCPDSNPFITCKDHTVSQESFEIVECAVCHFRFTNPIPEVNNLGKYYESEDYISHSDSKVGIVNFLYQKVRRYTIKQKFKLISGSAKEKSLLDIGSGTGHFLNYAATRGWKVQGIEASEPARKYCKENYSLNAEPADFLANVSPNSYGIITLWHVLEHVYDLKKDAKKISEILAPDGTLFIAVPNCACYDAKKYGKYWAAYDVPRHLYHFRPNDISALFSPFNLEVKKILPMPFDSFYISLLSEKYQSGKKNITLKTFVRGFLIGFMSYLKAQKNSSSSQIYVLQHK